MLKFHAVVYGDSGQASPGSGPLPVSFDDALTRLGRLPRLFIEPDGSFVWTGDSDGETWQVDGNLLDQGETLACVEVKGRCPEEHFGQLLAAFGWPQTRLSFQLPQRGVLQGEAEFRELAATGSGAV